MKKPVGYLLASVLINQMKKIDRKKQQQHTKSWVYFSLALGYFVLCGSTPVTYSSAHFLILKGSRAICNSMASCLQWKHTTAFFLAACLFDRLPSQQLSSFKATTIFPLASWLLLSSHHCEPSVSFVLDIPLIHSHLHLNIPFSFCSFCVLLGVHHF